MANRKTWKFSNTYLLNKKANHMSWRSYCLVGVRSLAELPLSVYPSPGSSERRFPFHKHLEPQFLRILMERLQRAPLLACSVVC